MMYQEHEFNISDGGPVLSPVCRARFPIGQNSHTDSGGQRGLLMLGGSLLQLPAIRIAREEGWRIILADGNPAVLARPWVDHFEPVDLKDKEAMLAMARRWHDQGRLHAVFTAGTDFSATVAYVAEALGLPGISHEAALNASSKLRMRRIFRDAGIPSPGFIELEAGVQPAPADLDRLQLPVVVKPIDNMGARGVRRLDDWQQLPEALAEARGFSRHGTVILEEFIEGPEYSIDSLVVAGRLVPCGLAVRHIKFPPFFVEVGHTLPSDLDETSTDKLVAVFSRAVAALGITSGAAKGDVFMTAKGPVIGEIAARLSGGYMSGWTFPLASGLELTRAALYLAMGLPLPSLAPPLDMVCAERAIISIPGRVAAMEGLKKALAPVAIKHCFTRVKVGDSVVFPRNNVEKAANIIAIGSNHHEASQAAESAIAGCLVRLAPGCVETEAFLFSPTVSQQPAYPGLLAAIPLPLDYRIACLQLAEQPALLAEQDWSWRSLAQSLDWLEQENLIRSVESFGSKRFWVALAWGGLQGAIYVMDTGIAEKTGVTLPS